MIIVKNELINFTHEQFEEEDITSALKGDKKQLDALLTPYTLLEEERESKAAKAAGIIAGYNPRHVLISLYWLTIYTSHLVPKLQNKGIEPYYSVQEWEADVQEDLTTA